MITKISFLNWKMAIPRPTAAEPATAVVPLKSFFSSFFLSPNFGTSTGFEAPVFCWTLRQRWVCSFRSYPSLHGLTSWGFSSPLQRLVAGLRVLPTGQILGVVGAAILWQRPVWGLRYWSERQSFFWGSAWVLLQRPVILLRKVPSGQFFTFCSCCLLQRPVTLFKK